MGDFRIVIEASGPHGCDRKAKDGEKIEPCFVPGCPDCMALELVNHLIDNGMTPFRAELTHWPHDCSAPGRSYTKEYEVKDDFLTMTRSGSFR